MNIELIAWIIGGIVAIITISILIKINKESQELLKDWAKANNFDILSRQNRRFFIGPYSWKARNATVWFVKVRTKDGDSGYVWVRIPFLGWEAIEYQWDGY